MTNELKQLISIIRKSNNLPSDEKALSLAQVLICLPNYEIYGNNFAYTSTMRKKALIEVDFRDKKQSFFWEMTKDLDEQSETTINQILKLLNND